MTHELSDEYFDSVSGGTNIDFFRIMLYKHTLYGCVIDTNALMTTNLNVFCIYII